MSGLWGELPQEKELQGVLCRAEHLRTLGRRREAAAALLQAATIAGSTTARESFRRRSAELLRNESQEGRRPLAC